MAVGEGRTNRSHNHGPFKKEFSHYKIIRKIWYSIKETIKESFFCLSGLRVLGYPVRVKDQLDLQILPSKIYPGL